MAGGQASQRKTGAMRRFYACCGGWGRLRAEARLILRYYAVETRKGKDESAIHQERASDNAEKCHMRKPNREAENGLSRLLFTLTLLEDSGIIGFAGSGTRRDGRAVDGAGLENQ
jgi:hypothetical protein